MKDAIRSLGLRIASLFGRGEKTEWNDDMRHDLREALRWNIAGELRLAKHGSEEILEICREGFIEDECPENERQGFIQFAAEEIERSRALLESEKAAWPKETDCDRLDRVETALRERGILLWQVSPCCDSCTVGELPDRIAMIDRRHPGFRERRRGYAFFIDQNMPEKLSEGTAISFHLGYGWISPDGSNVARDLYRTNALGIAGEVCECLRAEAFEPDWNGDIGQKIGLALNWQRRTMLE